MSLNPDILFDRSGAAGHVILNRPGALNAVTYAMVRALAQKLDEWENDPSVTRVIVTARGARAFSAGGDLRALYELGRAGQQAQALEFFRAEYRLNHRIKHYPKPYVSLIDGIVMGGGAGVSVHGSHRVAGDRFGFAMPEVGIGFFPDIGATWFLPRLPGSLGTYCALTGERLNAADGVAGGLATHRVASARLVELAGALERAHPVDTVLGEFSQPDQEGPILRQAKALDLAFRHDTVEDVLVALDAAAAGNGPAAAFATAAANSIRTKSPTSLKIALAQMRRGLAMDFAECMRTEFRIVTRVMCGHDFYEGVRAAIIDKDQSPRWQPSALEAVTAAEVEDYFEPLKSELELT